MPHPSLLKLPLSSAEQSVSARLSRRGQEDIAVGTREDSLAWHARKRPTLQRPDAYAASRRLPWPPCPSIRRNSQEAKSHARRDDDQRSSRGCTSLRKPLPVCSQRRASRGGPRRSPPSYSWPLLFYLGPLRFALGQFRKDERKLHRVSLDLRYALIRAGRRFHPQWAKKVGPFSRFPTHHPSILKQPASGGNTT